MNFFDEFLTNIKHFLPKLPMAILALLLGMIGIKIVIFILRKSIKIVRIPKDLRGIIITLTKFLLWTMLLLVIFYSLGLGSLAYVISGSALVLVFLLNNSIAPLLGNVFSGIFLVSDPHIGVGKRIVTNDGKTEGVIEGIDMRKIRIRDDKGRLHVVPNSAVENSEWIILEKTK